MVEPRLTWPFWALEGCDGSGKSTVRKCLQNCLERRGLGVTVVGQHSWLHPLTTRLIVDVREQRRAYAPQEIANAYHRDKVLHLRHTIIPATQTAVVLADRSIVSDAVYMEALYGIPAQGTLSRFAATGLPFPDVVWYVDVPVATAVERIARRGRPTRHYERTADLTRICEIYEALFRRPDCPFAMLRFPNNAPDIEGGLEQFVIPVLLEAIVEQARL